MGLFSALRGQTIDVIEWTDNTPNTLAYKYNLGGKDIMMGAQLTVRESQVAVLVREGQLADIYQPGRYELTSANMPMMTKLQCWQYGFKSPFKSDVWFINTRQFLARKWGTSNPVMMRDAEFGVIRLRAFGIYSFRISDPECFLKQVLGTASCYTVEQVEEQLRRIVVSAMTDAVAESRIPVLDLAANYTELGAFTCKAATEKLQPLGLELTDFVIENISLPEDLTKAMDQRVSMGVLSNRGTVRVSANREAPKLKSGSKNCNSCGAAIDGQSVFCPLCGAKQESSACYCPACGCKLEGNMHFCPKCGAQLG